MQLICWKYIYRDLPQIANVYLMPFFPGNPGGANPGEQLAGLHLNPPMRKSDQLLLMVAITSSSNHNELSNFVYTFIIHVR